ncbi:MAG: hypothetical protein K8R67_10770 [Desulfobacteraceae bacterium]|nr:hypothetical protein [Desulfobacteraceae bacterium]
MEKIILGLSGALTHDPSAALYVGEKLVAAAEEERFIRDKHAKNKIPEKAAAFCLEYAGIRPDQIDVVAFPFAKVSLASPGRWHFARRYWYAPDRALDALFNGNRHYRRNVRRVKGLLKKLGISWDKIKFVPVEHHLAHASSAYHLSGFKEKCAILGIDGKGEYATTFFGFGENGKIHKIKEFFDPDSLGGMYGAFTQYLGFEMLDGEYKVMGMAPYGDPEKYDFSRLIDFDKTTFTVNTKFLNTVGLRRYKDEKGKKYYFSPRLIEWLGPQRVGDDIDDPYVDYAAAMQHLFEKVSLGLIDHYLGDIIKQTGKLCFAGGGALNVKLNQRIIAMPYVKELFAQPAGSDAGTAIGAASYAASLMGISVEKMDHVFLGPCFTQEQCLTAIKAQSESQNADGNKEMTWEIMDDPAKATAEILATGNPVAWFQGRMEFGPRALGCRSILGCPSIKGISDRINEQIKYRERWRPFCPSVLDTVAEDLLQTSHPAPYMTFTFEVAEHWRERIPEVVHEDGTARAQVVSKETNPKYYQLLLELEKLTGNGVVLNTSLNRRGEPVVCTPEDALNMFFSCNLEYLVLENILVRKIKKA